MNSGDFRIEWLTKIPEWMLIVLLWDRYTETTDIPKTDYNAHSLSLWVHPLLGPNPRMFGFTTPNTITVQLSNCKKRLHINANGDIDGEAGFTSYFRSSYKRLIEIVICKDLNGENAINVLFEKFKKVYPNDSVAFDAIKNIGLGNIHKPTEIKGRQTKGQFYVGYDPARAGIMTWEESWRVESKATQIMAITPNLHWLKTSLEREESFENDPTSERYYRYLLTHRSELGVVAEIKRILEYKQPPGKLEIREIMPGASIGMDKLDYFVPFINDIVIISNPIEPIYKGSKEIGFYTLTDIPPTLKDEMELGQYLDLLIPTTHIASIKLWFEYYWTTGRTVLEFPNANGDQ